ncbi:hypothetical protein AVEN_247859-1 [Araneus ventricosus]|uniref:HTH CENPB-type domain-containing protein n=1 Tax=Araneus ventricosus TaxID=182803 RepID=A0A4Y2FRB6_ARAVE|nr:hypothetical protein AVEN_247859-1 [Araneus ventricosus]
MRHEKYVDINEAVLEWFKTVRAKKIPASGPMIQHKAKELANALGIENFSASSSMGGWTDFAYGITLLFDHCVAKQPMSTPVYVKISRSVFHFFRVDMMTRTYLTWTKRHSFFRALPNKSMIQKSEEARGGKIPKERLTISFCVSAAGEKGVSRDQRGGDVKFPVVNVRKK